MFYIMYDVEDEMLCLNVRDVNGISNEMNLGEMCKYTWYIVICNYGIKKYRSTHMLYLFVIINVVYEWLCWYVFEKNGEYVCLRNIGNGWCFWNEMERNNIHKTGTFISKECDKKIDRKTEFTMW